MNLVIDISLNNQFIALFMVLLGILYFEYSNSVYNKLSSTASNIYKYLDCSNEFTHLNIKDLEYDEDDEYDDEYDDESERVEDSERDDESERDEYSEHDDESEHDNKNKTKNCMYYIKNRDKSGLTEYVKDCSSTVLLSNTTKEDRNWIYKTTRKEIFSKKIYTKKDNCLRFLMLDKVLYSKLDPQYHPNSIVKLNNLIIASYNVDNQQSEKTLNVDYKLSDIG